MPRNGRDANNRCNSKEPSFFLASLADLLTVLRKNAAQEFDMRWLVTFFRLDSSDRKLKQNKEVPLKIELSLHGGSYLFVGVVGGCVPFCPCLFLQVPLAILYLFLFFAFF